MRVFISLRSVYAELGAASIGDADVGVDSKCWYRFARLDTMMLWMMPLCVCFDQKFGSKTADCHITWLRVLSYAIPLGRFRIVEMIVDQVEVLYSMVMAYEFYLVVLV